MENCKDCESKSSWKCVSCSVFLCAVHKRSHNEDDQEHHFIKCKLHISEELNSKTLKSITSKIKLLDEYSNTIIKSTKLILTELIARNKEILNNIEQNRTRYNHILQQLNEEITEEQLKVIEKESITVSLQENLIVLKCYLEELWFSIEILKEFVIDPNPQNNEEYAQSVSKVITHIFQTFISSIGTPCMNSDTLRKEKYLYYGEIEEGLREGRGIVYIMMAVFMTDIGKIIYQKV